MVHFVSFADGLARTCLGLVRMTLYPQIPGQDSTGEVLSLKAEIACCAPLRLRRTLQRRLKFDTGAGKVTTEVQ